MPPYPPPKRVKAMSEVTRYDLCEFESGLIARDSGFLVGASDYDALKAERDALQQRMTAAEKRVGDLEGLLQMFVENSDDKDVVELSEHALKPAEGDGS